MAKKTRARRTHDDHGGDYRRWQSGLRPPKTIAIHHDDRCARFVGRTAPGEQFVLTAPYVTPDHGPAPRYPRRDFVALYLFDKKGAFLRATIIDLGTREKKDAKMLRATKLRAEMERDKLLAGLGEVTFGNVKIAPFTVTRFKTEFGLTHSAPEDPFEPWLACLGPGAYMIFRQPWDGGSYETEYLAEPLF